MRQQIRTQDAPPPAGAYSQGVRCGNLLFIAGQGPFAPDGSLVTGTVTDQVRQCLENLEAIATAGGSSLRNAVRMTVFLQDLANWAEMDAAYAEHFGEIPPARTTVQAGLNGFDVEIDAIVEVS